MRGEIYRLTMAAAISIGALGCSNTPDVHRQLPRSPLVQPTPSSDPFLPELEGRIAQAEAKIVERMAGRPDCKVVDVYDELEMLTRGEVTFQLRDLETDDSQTVSDIMRIRETTRGLLQRRAVEIRDLQTSEAGYASRLSDAYFSLSTILLGSEQTSAGLESGIEFGYIGECYLLKAISFKVQYLIPASPRRI